MMMNWILNPYQDTWGPFGPQTSSAHNRIFPCGMFFVIFFIIVGKHVFNNMQKTKHIYLKPFCRRKLWCAIVLLGSKRTPDSKIMMNLTQTGFKLSLLVHLIMNLHNQHILDRNVPQNEKIKHIRVWKGVWIPDSLPNGPQKYLIFYSLFQIRDEFLSIWIHIS